MTIVTKPLTSEKKPTGDTLVVPLVVPETQNADVEKGKNGGAAGGNLDGGLSERYHYILRNRAARVSSATTLCLLITALLVMTVGLFGGLYIYRQMNRVRMHKFRGWCNVPYYADPLYQNGRDGNDLSLSEPRLGMIPQADPKTKIDNDGLTYYFGDPDESQSQVSYFKEELEVDLDQEKYAKVEVPDFKNGRMGRFIHEFDSNKTAIVDQTAKRCFIMPLDRERVLPPKSMYDMIEKMYQGYYSVNTHRVRETMRVVLPPIDDLSDLGDYIQQECEDKTTFRLEKSTDRVFKRSADEPKSLPYVEFAGVVPIEYDIVNLNELDAASS